MYRGSVSTFADLSVTLVAAPRYVQRFHFWPLKSAYFLETQWGPPLFEAPGCLPANNTIQESIWVGRQTSLQGGTRFRMLRAQFWSLRKANIFQKGPQSGPLRIESGPSWQACFWSLHFAMCAKFQAWSYPHTNIIRGGNLVFKVQKTDASLWQVEAKAVQTPPWTPELAQVHVTDPASPPCPPK